MKRMMWAMMLMAALSGCGRENRVVGVWRTEVELSDAINAALEAEELGEFLEVSTFPVRLEFTFNENGTYACQADEERFAETVENMKEELTEGFTRYTRHLVTETGREMEVAEVFEALGVSLDEMLDEAFELEKLTGLSAGEEAGRYEIRGDRLYFSKSVDGEVEWESWDEFWVEGDRMTFLSCQGTPNAAFAAEEYPVVFEKVG